MLGISTTNLRVNGFRGGIDADAKIIYNRIIADSGVSNLSRLNYLVKGLKTIYGSLSNTPVCYDAHWIGYQPANGVGATSGQACAKLYSLTVAGDGVQATASAQPLLLAHGGAVTDNYWFSPRITGNSCSTPNAAVNRISGDIEIQVKFQSNTNGAITQTLLFKGDASSYNYAFDISSNFLRFIYGGFTLISATTTINPLLLQWYKVTRNSTTGDVKFYTSTDGITYTQLGATVPSAVGILPVNNFALTVSDNTAFTGNGAQGNIYRATIANSIGGTPVVDFNPASYNAATSQTQWTSSTSEVWTINTGTAATGYKGVLVDRTIVQSDGVEDLLLTGNVDLSTTDKLTMFTSLKRLTNNVGIVFNVGSNPNRFLNLVNTNVIGIANINGGLTNEFSLPNNTSLFLLTNTLDRSQVALSEQNGYFNNILQTKSTISASDTSGNLGNNPISLFARIDTIAPFNGIINTAILALNVNDSTTRTAMYNFIKSLNNNAF